MAYCRHKISCSHVLIWRILLSLLISCSTNVRDLPLAIAALFLFLLVRSKKTPMAACPGLSCDRGMCINKGISWDLVKGQSHEIRMASI